MGNRAVITTKDNFVDNGIGVYLHWNGGRDSVEAFLKYCELRGFRSPDRDHYGWARLVQVISNFFGPDGLSIGVDVVDHLDCDNWDNGVYFIEGWQIVGRKYFEGEEQHSYDLNEMLIAIDEAQPEHQQLGAYILAKEVPVTDLKVGDKIYYKNPWNGKLHIVEILALGDDRVVNGTNVKGMPYADICGGGLGKDNINNYIREETVRLAPGTE